MREVDIFGLKDTEARGVYKGNPAEKLATSSTRMRF